LSAYFFQYANKYVNDAEIILRLLQCFVSGICGRLKKTAVKQCRGGRLKRNTILFYFRRPHIPETKLWNSLKQL